MTITYDYTVQINGCDFEFESNCWCDYWYDKPRVLKEVTFDTFEQAQEFVSSITAKQAREWEREVKRNGLRVIIFKDEVLDGGNYDDFEIVGEREFVGGEEYKAHI